MIKNADTAMYHAKKMGRNNFQYSRIPERPRPYPLVLDEWRSVGRVFLLLLHRFLFPWRVLRLFLACLRGLMRHGSLL